MRYTDSRTPKVLLSLYGEHFSAMMGFEAIHQIVVALGLTHQHWDPML